MPGKYQKLVEKHVLVIGGSSGIGYCVAEASLESGASVIISSSSADRITKAVKRLQSSYPGGKVAGYAGIVDHIVFTAGDPLATIPLKDVTLETIKQAGQVRFFAPLLVAKVGSRYLSAGPQASITLTTGATADKPYEGWIVVTSFAAGLHGMARGLAVDLAPVRVNVVSPGAVKTELWGGMEEEERAAVFKGVEEKVLTKHVAGPEEVAESYLWLMKDSNVTGTVLGRFSLFKRPSTAKEEPANKTITSGLMIDPPHSDLIVNSPVILSDIELTRSNLSQDIFIGALHDSNYTQLQENVRRLRRAPVGPDPKNVDAAWEVYKKQREESLKYCRKLIEKSQEHHARNPSLESSVGPLDTRSSLSSGSVNDASLPFQINPQWLSAIREYKAVQETLLNTLHTSLVVTYTAYEPDASQRQLDIFLKDKEHRKSVITKWRDTSVRRVRSEKPEFFEKYKIRSLNFDKLKHDIEESERLFDTGHTPNRVIRESVIYKNGDTVLEFAYRPSDSLPIIRFRVSSHFLIPDDVSPLFSQMFCPGPIIPLDMMHDLPKAPSKIIGKDGIGVNVYRMPQMEPNSHEALTLLLHAIHGHTQMLPRDDIDFPVFISIADYRWLPQWESRAAESNPKELLLIAYAFGARELFTRISRSIILNAKDDDDTRGQELWPQVINNTIRTRRAIYMEQILEYCASVIHEYLQPPRQSGERPVHVGSLEMSTVRCPRGSHTCDATNLGWLMLVFNELGVSPLSPRPSSKRSLKELIDSLRLMPSPPRTHIGVCDFAPSFRSKINDISNTIIGLTLYDVSGQYGWALISTKESIFEAEKAKEATREAVSLSILSLLENIEDLHAAAMIDKTFYGAYMKNEGRLLRNIYLPSRTMDLFTVQDEDIYDVSPSLSPTDIATMPIPTSEEEARELLTRNVEATSRAWATRDSLQSHERGMNSAQNEKFLAGDFAHTEDKARLEEESKQLQTERDKVMNFRV
ncbi:hypothetical protein EYC80_008685 [Monilinia laxa]|uniref:Uncharacterized protein n=1 Tax=Monilinia laxa TaxID=61186 RepID=A0A5N6K1F2_MONLA|nr:hypothetical protein EYC80_008685 [Monilinia laxa]